MKAYLRRVASASISEEDCLRDPAAAFHVALATARAAYLAQVGRNAKRQDPQGLGPKDEHAVPPEEAGCAQTTPGESQP
jgi:hypothetical protein